MTKPRETKNLQGTLRKCRDNPNAPKLPVVCPATSTSRLSPEGAKAWPEVVRLVNELHVCTAADLVALECMAEALGDLRAARSALAQPLVRDGVELARGNERYYWTGTIRRQRPEVMAVASAERRFGTWAAKFGITPVDRQKVASLPPDDGNAFGEF